MTTQNHLVNGLKNQYISPLDRGFAYGDGVFRTLRMQGGVPVNWQVHYPKLVADCAAIGIVCPNAELFIDDLTRLFIDDVADNTLAVAKIIVTRGESERGYATPSITTPMRVVIKSRLPKYSEEHFLSGVTLTVCKTRLAHQKQLAGVKHLNRLENVMARMEWRDETIFDGILLDQNDKVIECTMSNIFARFGQQLITPALDETGVAGVTRSIIMGFASALDLTIQTGTLDLNKLLDADEVIICNSLFGALQVKTIGDKTWPTNGLDANIRNLMQYNKAS